MRISDWSSDVCSSDLVAETDRIAIAVGDDQWPIGGRVGELGAGLQGHGLTRAVDLTDRDIGVGGGQRIGDIVEADAGRSEEHTSELQSLMRISYAVFCLKKKTNIKRNKTSIICR